MGRNSLFPTGPQFGNLALIPMDSPCTSTPSGWEKPLQARSGCTKGWVWGCSIPLSSLLTLPSPSIPLPFPLSPCPFAAVPLLLRLSG